MIVIQKLNGTKKKNDSVWLGRERDKDGRVYIDRSLTAPVCLRSLTETLLISDLSNHWLRGNAVTIGQDLPLNTNNGEASHNIVHTLTARQNKL